MEKFPSTCDQHALRNYIIKELLKWFFCVVLLASSPLFFKITFELVSRTSWKIIAEKYCSECILAACALASCIFAIDIDSKSQTILRSIIKYISIISICFCVCFYFAFYYELDPTQQTPEVWNNYEVYTYFFISIVIYVWHIFAGLYITFCDSREKYLFQTFFNSLPKKVAGIAQSTGSPSDPTLQ